MIGIYIIIFLTAQRFLIFLFSNHITTTMLCITVILHSWTFTCHKNIDFFSITLHTQYNVNQIVKHFPVTRIIMSNTWKRQVSISIYVNLPVRICMYSFPILMVHLSILDYYGLSSAFFICAMQHNKFSGDLKQNKQQSPTDDSNWSSMHEHYLTEYWLSRQHTCSG